jgi:hypothetical protein
MTMNMRDRRARETRASAAERLFLSARCGISDAGLHSVPGVNQGLVAVTSLVSDRAWLCLPSPTRSCLDCSGSGGWMSSTVTAVPYAEANTIESFAAAASCASQLQAKGRLGRTRPCAKTRDGRNGSSGGPEEGEPLDGGVVVASLNLVGQPFVAAARHELSY